MICEIRKAPIQSPVLRRLGVRREPALISADFGISEVGTKKLIVDTAQARLIDIGDDKPGSLHATIPSHMPLLFTCLVHMKDDRVLTAGGLSGIQAQVLPVGRYFVHVRVTCGDAEFTRGREVMVGTKAPFTAWLGS